MKAFLKKTFIIISLLISLTIFISINTKADGTKTTFMIDLDKGSIVLKDSCSGWITNYNELKQTNR